MEITRMLSVPKGSRIVMHDKLVYLSGQVSSDLSGGIEDQTAGVLKRIDEHLALAGIDRSRLLYATVHLKDIRDVDAMNAVWIAWLGDKDQPARTCVQATMGLPEILVEITAVAAR